jgi:hypothetical protein
MFVYIRWLTLVDIPLCMIDIDNELCYHISRRDCRNMKPYLLLRRSSASALSGRYCHTKGEKEMQSSFTNTAQVTL